MIVRPSFYEPCVTVPVSAHTWEGFRDWVYSGDFPERGRISFIDEEIIVDMSPERFESQGKVKCEVSRVIANIVKAEDLGEFLPDRTWLTNQAADLSNEPDGSFVTWETLTSGRIRLIPLADGADGIELQGSADWAMEIVSNTSERKDTVLLPVAYYRAGVQEYWLIDARGDAIQFTVFVRGADELVAVEPDEDGWHASAVFGRQFRLTRTRDRIGAWQYTLEQRQFRP